MLSECDAIEREILTGGKMLEITDKDRQLARSATDGEGLGPEVLERIERAVAKGREEGRAEILEKDHG